MPRDRTSDGASFLPLIEGDSIARAKPLDWQYNRAGSKVKVALRDGAWKILARLEPPYSRAGPDAVWRWRTIAAEYPSGIRSSAYVLPSRVTPLASVPFVMWPSRS